MAALWPMIQQALSSLNLCGFRFRKAIIVDVEPSICDILPSLIMSEIEADNSHLVPLHTWMENRHEK